MSSESVEGCEVSSGALTLITSSASDMSRWWHASNGWFDLPSSPLVGEALRLRMKSCAVRLLRDRCTCPIAPKPTNIKALDRPSMPVHWQSCPPDTLSLLPPICISLSQSSSDLSVCLPSSFLHSLSDVQMFHGSAPLFRDWSSCLKLSVTDSLLLDLNSITSREPNPTSRYTLHTTHLAGFMNEIYIYIIF